MVNNFFIEKDNDTFKIIPIANKSQLHNLEEKAKEKYDNPHLCWDCKNGYPTKCAKIQQLRFSRIDDYDFITAGYQIVKDGIIDKFMVYGCENFEKAPIRTVKEQLQAEKDLYKISDSLFAYYYNAATIEEAQAIRSRVFSKCNKKN